MNTHEMLTCAQAATLVLKEHLEDLTPEEVKDCLGDLSVLLTKIGNTINIPTGS